MSRNLAMEHYYEVTTNDKDAVAECLLSFADYDCDFNGENGIEYLWAEAEGFESNAEYCLSIAKNEPTPREMVQRFVSLWMGRDPYYYDYDLGVLVKGDLIFISLAFVAGV